MFWFLLFLHFHSCFSFFLSLSFTSSTILYATCLSKLFTLILTWRSFFFFFFFFFLSERPEQVGRFIGEYRGPFSDSRHSMFAYMCHVKSIWAGAQHFSQLYKCAQWRLRSACPFPRADQSSLSAWRRLGSTHRTSCEDSDQTARQRRLIWVFAGRTCKL